MDTCFFSSALLLLIPICFSFTSSQPFFNLNLTTDEQALIAFKNSIVSNPDDSILLKNWSIHAPICNWIGVSCGTKHLRVTAITLSGLGLRGSIAPHLGNLTFLRFLDMSSNSFSGALPSELSKLRRLQKINLEENYFTGEIPTWFGALPELEAIRLNNNSFSGRIPGCIFLNVSRLRVLNLENNFLDGNIPVEIGTSPSLEGVSFAGNQLWGSIPNDIFNVSSLKIMNLRFNKLTGKITNNICSNTPRLSIFSVASNQLYGEIPPNIRRCRDLEFLELQDNNFNGKVQGEIGSLSKLKILVLWQNQFKGEIPDEFCNLTSLIEVYLSNNSFSGTIPPFIYNLSTLQRLELAFNNFSGTLPSNLGLSLSNLQQLRLQNNSLSGIIPTSINNASQLNYLNLASNSFHGSIPNLSSLRLLTDLFLAINYLSTTPEMEFLSSLTNSKYLRLVEISANPLNALLPASIGNLSQSLEVFSAVRASIRGALPSEIGNLTNLIYLSLSANQLSGSIPRTIRNSKKLEGLMLSSNQFQGSIPTVLCNLSSLAQIYLEFNELEGSIPECLGEMQSLRVIELSSNKLNSTIPPNFWNLTDLVFLYMSSNYLTGRLSSPIGKLKVINEMDFSSNLLSGEIPSSIEGCQSLEYLYLSDNKFGGSIPRSLGNMRGLSGLDLSNNNLSGFIPKSLKGLKFLEYLNVSYNRLEGEIPNGGAFANFTAESFFHNSALCGASRFEVPPCLDVDARSKNNGRLIKYILPPLVSTLILVIIAVILIRRRKHIKLPIPVDASSIGVPWRITFHIELSRATNSFSDTNLLGRGSFGSVFKGTFPDGLHFAAKVFNLELEGANKSFEIESRILSTIRHRNLVRVVGCCTNMEFKALILEFMPNGSLDKWLYSDNYCIDVIQLLNISIDVGQALEYLHHGNASPVVHCDVKPSNVLLDEDMTARVSDFGIAKLFEEGDAMIQTKTLATIGYAAPEYGSEGKVSTSADVYSFGIMLLEMFTRKKPTDDMFDEELSLRKWVSEALQVNAMNQILAPALLSEEDRHFVSKDKCVASVFDLAMKCLAVSPEERINMIEATRVLMKINENFESEVAPMRQHHAITVT